MVAKEKEKEETKEIAKVEPTLGERFTNMVIREFSEIGTVDLDPYKKRLAQHLFLGVDMALKRQEADRQKKNETKLPIVWANVNMQQLAFNAMHCVELGLDALIPNHLHVVPYLNGKTGKYDLSLDIGYVGKDFYKRKMAIKPPKDIVYQLVYETDVFEPIMKTAQNNIESYRFEIKKPFNRGAVIGGFGYIIREDPTENQLIIVPKTSFDQSKNKARSQAFWGPYEEQMQMVALVRRVTAKLNIDPEKVNASFMKVEIDDTIQEAEREVDEKANKGFMGEEGEVVEAEFSATEGDEGKGAESENGNGKSFADWIKQYDEILGTDIVDDELKKMGLERDNIKPGQRKGALAGLAGRVDRENQDGGPDF